MIYLSVQQDRSANNTPNSTDSLNTSMIAANNANNENYLREMQQQSAMNTSPHSAVKEEPGYVLPDTCPFIADQPYHQPPNISSNNNNNEDQKPLPMEHFPVKEERKTPHEPPRLSSSPPQSIEDEDSRNSAPLHLVTEETSRRLRQGSYIICDFDLLINWVAFNF